MPLLGAAPVNRLPFPQIASDDMTLIPSLTAEQCYHFALLLSHCKGFGLPQQKQVKFCMSLRTQSQAPSFIPQKHPNVSVFLRF